MKKNLISVLLIGLLVGLMGILQKSTAQNYSLYGLANKGGAYGLGVLYRYEYPSGKDTVILNFNGTNGEYPGGDLIIASDGNIYGTTETGGTSSCGVLYRINPKTYVDTVVFEFNKHLGAYPKGGLMQASNGILYGSASEGGAYNKGVLYSYDITTKTQSVLFSFSGTDGLMPGGHLIQASNGLLYGLTVEGGLYGDGELYCYNINTGLDSVVLNFNGTNGKEPKGGIQATNGLIYGVTHFGGTNNSGLLYSYNPVTGLQTVLMSFTGPNGIYPTSDATSLFETSGGLIYGIAEMGGASNHGLLYTYNINTGHDSILINFGPAGILGQSPDDAGYMQLPGGIMIIPIDSGGEYGLGTLLSYNPTNGDFKKLMDFNDTNGAIPHTDLIFIENISEGVTNTIQNKETINLFPNPNTGQFTLSYNSAVIANGLLEVYNVLGQRVYYTTLKQVDGNAINLGKQVPGIYLYRVITLDGNEICNGKFVIE